MTERRRILHVVDDPLPLRTRLLGLVRWEGSRFRSVRAFFRLSLGTAADIEDISLEAFLRDPARAAGYDAIVVNNGYVKRRSAGHAERLGIIAKLNVPKILFDSGDRPDAIAPDSTLDVFDLVFKREPFRDRGRYPITERNRRKIRATMLPCLSLMPSRFRDVGSIDVAAYGERQPSTRCTTDVFFLGGATSPQRVDVVRLLRRQPFVFRGGLHAGLPELHVDRELYARRVLQGTFVARARDAKINLALEGRGPFTLRHLDFWCLSCFMLSPPGIAEIETPLPFVDGKHYVSFASPGDLLDKIRYFLERDAERTEIASAGRRMFEEHYSFIRHGQSILHAIESVCMEQSAAETALPAIDFQSPTRELPPAFSAHKKRA